MSGPTWPPPKTPGSPERPVPQMSDSGPAVYREPPKKVSSDTRPKYVVHDQNREGGGMASRYMATGPTAGPMQQHHQEDPRFHPKSNDDYYHQPPPHGLKEDQSLNPHMDRFQLMHRGPPEKPVGPHSIIDAEIASLTCMLDDLDSYSQNSTQLYDNVPYNKRITGDRSKPSAQTGAPSQSRLFMGLPPHPQPQYRPTPPFPRHPLYFPQPDYADAQVSKPYPKPVPSSTPTGPRFSVQDKTAQPVTYSQMGRQAEQGYSPPPHHQHALRPSPQNQTVPHGWYPSNPASQAQELHSARGYKGSATGSGGRVTQCPTSNRGPETKKSVSCSAPSFACQPSKGSAALRSEEELDQLTKKLVYDMNHPPTEEFFGRCARCGDNILADVSGCIAMEQVFHVECFTCVTCHTRLGWQLFYALDKQSYCESCYISTLERCCMCYKLIRDHILRFMGKAFHPCCFNCVVCGCCLEGVPFTVDANYQIYCLDDFHRKFASCCSVCGQAIMPEPGQDAAVRIVALDRSFHVNCYVCEECGLLLSSEIKGRGCYPFDGHILCKGCSARRIQDLSAISPLTDHQL
ncbi:thyroid receptor-interacting protein 6-like isoform X2 [Salmo salar]|uniref:Thyroid receptor-interacting protein 6-like isoform X2 n=1 Tax=Salmo salar TaxID=8030 RepID=A0A1S3SDH8_SALSA|nr:thyroid receptor-interacting protein 6-like isoform X2 [Salmo salar]|eukprot:XP_014062399.1 PREDICTED: thyroid receptor-interacting protein 6-like isoform X2 [Salmo salar]